MCSFLNGLELRNEETETMIDFNEETVTYDSMEICPYPPEYLISPCKCFADDKFRAHLICDLEEDIAADIIINLNKVIGCRNEIFYFKVNMNGNALTLDLNEESFGNLKITKFHVANVGKFFWKYCFWSFQ